MAIRVPRYDSKVSSIHPAPAPYASVSAILPDSSALSQAVGQVGGTVDAFATKERETRDELEALQAIATHDVGQAKLKDEAAADPDYENAPAKYAEKSAELSAKSLAGIANPQRRRAVALQIQRAQGLAQVDVNRTARQKGIDAGQASLATGLDALHKQAAAASTDDERGLYLQQAQERLAQAAQAGFISREEAAKTALSFAGKLDSVTAQQRIMADPHQAFQDLQDPGKYRGLSPEARQSLSVHALTAANARDAKAERDQAKAERDQAKQSALDQHKAVGGIVAEIVGQVTGLGAANGSAPAAPANAAYPAAPANAAYPAAPANAAYPAAPANAAYPADSAELIRSQAQAQGVDERTALTVARLENAKGDPAARPMRKDGQPLSSALGLFQMIGDTWTARGGSDADRADPARQAELGVANIKAEADALRAGLGREPAPWEIYLGHQQGGPGALKLLTADASARAAEVVGAKAVTNNGGTADISVGAFRDLWQARYAQAEAKVGGSPQATPVAVTSATGATVYDPAQSPWRQENEAAALAAAAGRLTDDSAQKALDARIRSIFAVNRRVNNERWTARETARHAIVVDMDVAAERGQVTYTELAAARAGGVITDDEWKRQTMALDAVHRRDDKDALTSALVARRLSGDRTVVLDHKDGDTRRGVDKTYRAVAQGWQDLPPADQLARAAAWARGAGMIPSSIDQQLTASLRDGSPEQKLAAAQTLAYMATPDVWDHGPDILQAGALSLAGEDKTARLVMQGHELRATVAKPGSAARQFMPPKDEAFKSAWDTYLPAGLLSGLPPKVVEGLQDGVISAYVALSHQAGAANQSSVDGGRFEQAVALVTGGQVALNGQWLIAPKRGMDQEAFDDVMASLQDHDLAEARWTDGSGLTADAVRRNGTLLMVGAGRYFVQVGEGLVGDLTGQPFVLDLGRLAERPVRKVTPRTPPDLLEGP